MSVDSVNEESKCEQCAPAPTSTAEGSTDTAMDSPSDMAGEGMANKAEEGAEKTDDQG